MTLERHDTAPPFRRRNGLLFLVTLAGVALLYGSVVPRWARDLWDDPNFSHGLAVPLFSAYVAWGRRRGLVFRPGEDPGLPGILLPAVAILLLVAGKAAGEYFTMRASLVVMVAGLVRLAFGREGARELLFPVAFLFFAVPIPYLLYDVIAFPSRLFSMLVAERLLHAFAVPAFREGNLIHLPNIRLDIVEACSGIRSLMTLVTLGTVAAYLFRLGWFRYLVLTLAAAGLTILANSLRIFLTGLLAFRFSSRFAQGFAHEAVGVVVFLSAVALLVLLGRFLSPAGRDGGTPRGSRDCGTAP